MKADDRTRTDNLLITNQLLCQLSHIGEVSTQLIFNQSALPHIALSCDKHELSHIGMGIISQI